MTYKNPECGKGATNDYSDISANDSATDVTGAQLEELTDGSETTLHSHAGGGSFTMNLIDLIQGTMQQHDSTGDLAIEWKTQEETDSNFSHSTTVDPEQITCLTAGWLHIIAQVQYDQDDGARLNTESFLTVNSTRLDRSTGNRSYYRGLNYGRWGTAQLHLYLEVAADDVLELHSQVADGAVAFGASRAIDTIPASTFIQIRFLG